MHLPAEKGICVFSLFFFSLLQIVFSINKYKTRLSFVDDSFRDSCFGVTYFHCCHTFVRPLS